MKPKDYHTSGYAAGIFGVTPQRFEQLADQAGVAPALSLDGLRYWDDEALQAVVQVLKRTGESPAVQQLTTPGEAGFHA